MDAGAWDARYAASELVWSASPNRFVVEELAYLRPGRAVDVACGEGRNAIWLAQLGWQVTAIDFSQVALDKGAQLAGDLPITWVCADVTHWRGADVDLALVAYLQVGAHARETVMRAAFEALAPGGTLLVVAHDSTNLTEGVGGPQDPTVLYTAQDVLTDLAGLDKVVEKAERVPRVVPTPDGHGERGTAWDALVRVRRQP